jgi:hypothetical protein
MKKTILLLVLLFTIFSCNNKEPIPTSFVQLGETKFDVKTAYFDDFGKDGTEFNTEFFLFGLTDENLDKCLLSKANCEINALHLDLYSNAKIPQDGTYFLDKGFQGSNYGKAELVYVKAGAEMYAEIISGVVEIKGSGTNNLSINVTGRSSKGENISAEFTGTFLNAKTTFGDQVFQNLPKFQFSKTFNNSNGLLKLDKNQLELNSGFYYDYGFDSNEYNKEFYLFDLSEEAFLKCLIEEGENCQLQGIFMDVYSNRKLPNDAVFKIENDSGLNYAYVSVLYKIGNDFVEEALESGTLEIKGSNTDVLNIKIEGVSESGKMVTSQYSGKFKDLESLMDEFSQQGRKNGPNSQLKHSKVFEKFTARKNK